MSVCVCVTFLSVSDAVNTFIWCLFNSYDWLRLNVSQCVVFWICPSVFGLIYRRSCRQCAGHGKCWDQTAG